MELNRLNDIILSRLAFLSSEVKLRGTLNLLDVNVASEQVYSSILNILYGWNLGNANYSEQNSKAIDLVDDDAKLIVQVSSDNSTAKVQQSLDKIDTTKYDGYRFKFVSIARDVKHLMKHSFAIPSGIAFEVSSDCYDIKRISREAINADIDTVRRLAEYVEKAIIPASGKDLRPSVVTYVINRLSEINLLDAEVNPDVNPYDLRPKIDVNGLKRWGPIIEEYALFSLQVDKIYSQYDQLGMNKSYAVLAYLHDLYLNSIHDYAKDELFDYLLEKVYEAVDGDDTCNEGLSREELLLNIKIVLVDAFMKCKIFEKPE